MNRQQKLIYECASALLFVLAFVFFAVFYRGHLYYNEQYQMFLFSWDYFMNLFRLPGGFAAWVSRFLIQFFLFPTVGALIYACAISGVRILCGRLAGNRTFLSRMASFIPALFVWAVMCKERVQINIAVCIIICLGIACLCARSRHSSVLFIVLTPVLYWLCGFAAIMFSVASLTTRKWWPAVASVSLLVATVFALRPFVRFDIRVLFKGFFYMKDPEIRFTWPWLAFSVVAAYLAVFSYLTRENIIAAYGVLAGAFAGGAVTVVLMSSFGFDEEAIYSRLVRERKWDRIIRKAEKKMPMNRFSVANVNLALAVKGRLGDDIFKFVQPGTDGLIPPYKKLHDDNLICSDIFYYMGLPSPSQRHMFECNESIQSMEKGVRMYQRLAQTNSINNNFAASRKYLDALSKTLFYRKWAKEFDDYSEEMVHYRELRYHKEDFFFGHENLLNELGVLYQENPANEVAFQYAAAYALLLKDMDWFKKITSMKSFYKVPRSYQEAFLLIWVKDHKDLNGLPPFISSGITKRFQRFVDANNGGMDMEQLFKKFGDTYWFYFYYNIVK